MSVDVRGSYRCEFYYYAALQLYANYAEGLLFIVVVLCVCMCVCVSTHICRLTHWNHTTERYQRVHSNTAIVLNFADFLKNASFKCYGVICLPRVAPASKSFFPQEISFYFSVKPIATFSLLRQRACGRQRAIRWHRLVKNGTDIWITNTNCPAY